MNPKRVLLLHISNVSGHRSASLAIESALRQIDSGVEAKSIDAFGYTSPFFEKLINALYMGVIQSTPQFWDYLYDNPRVLNRLKGIRLLIHKAKEKKIEKLLEEFRPDIVVCTQAFPCGMVADYKRRHNLNLPIIGVLTDYAPHSYWLNDAVDFYVVPSEDIQRRFIEKGISEERLKILGIPIDTKFQAESNRQQIFRQLGLDSEQATILVMGGGQGLGPIKQIVRTLDSLSEPLQLIVVCGTNRKLYNWLHKNRAKFKKPMAIIGYTEQIHELMSVAAFVVTKPGGVTSAEALSKSLPMVVVRPLPGQESSNARFLLEMGTAIKVEDFKHLKEVCRDLVKDRAKLQDLRQKASRLASPDSGLKIARLILDILAKTKEERCFTSFTE